jgi:hypothetical protein
VLDRLNARIHSAVIVNDSRHVLQNKPSLGIGKLLNKRMEVMASPATDVDEKHLSSFLTSLSQDVFLDGEPIHPVLCRPTDSGHKRVEIPGEFRILGHPFKERLVHIEGILERSVVLVGRWSVAELSEIFRKLFENAESDVEAARSILIGDSLGGRLPRDLTGV